MDAPAADSGQGSVYLETPRAVVRLASEADVREIVRYYADNRERLEPFDPERPPIFYEERFWRMQIRQNLDDFVADRALSLFIFPRSAPERVIGNFGLSNFVRGVGQYCTLGYSIAGDFEGSGMMAEALRATIAFAFGSLHFHRIEANHLPHNLRSARLLQSLGFVVEGYSREYLRIGGAWQDHVRTGLVNPNWRDGSIR
jgi:ribosomal-protein-alanine N-acetyltransferase